MKKKVSQRALLWCPTVLCKRLASLQGLEQVTEHATDDNTQLLNSKMLEYIRLFNPDFQPKNSADPLKGLTDEIVQATVSLVA